MSWITTQLRTTSGSSGDFMLLMNSTSTVAFGY